MRIIRHSAAMTALSLVLAGCGGGSGGGERPALAPPPVAGPTPTPSPAPSSISSASLRFGVTADTDFATVGDDVEFRWVEAAKSYEIRFTGKEWERLTLADSGAAYENHYPKSGYYSVGLNKNPDYRHTNLATQFENGWGWPIGLFAYGVATKLGDVPVTGTASYQAKAVGRAGEAWEYNVGGTAELRFDFAAGTLAGHFDPTIDEWTNDVRALGRYSFVNTVFGAGSTKFSGELAHSSLAQLGSFNGMFTGPQAAELMAEWSAPYRNPWTGKDGTITGVWLGKRP